MIRYIWLHTCGKNVPNQEFESVILTLSVLRATRIVLEFYIFHIVTTSMFNGMVICIIGGQKYILSISLKPRPIFCGFGICFLFPVLILFIAKTRYSNILKILQPKKDNFQIKYFDTFSYFCSKLRLWLFIETAWARRF